MREPITRPCTVLVPLLNLSVAPALLSLAAALIAGADPYLPHEARVLVLAVVTVAPGQRPAEGRNMTRAYRAMLGYLPATVTPPGPPVQGAPLQVPVHTLIKVSSSVGAGIREAMRAEAADLLLLHWKGHAHEPGTLFGRITDDLLAAPPGNLILARLGSETDLDRVRRVLLPLRGGPAAELALEIGRTLADRIGTPVRLLHSVPPVKTRPDHDAPYFALQRHVEQPSDHRAPVEQVLTLTADSPSFVAEQMQPGDLVVLGLPEGPHRPAARGPMLDLVLADPARPVLLTRAARPLDLATYLTQLRDQPEVSWTAAQWFVENSYHYDEFADSDRWQLLRRERQAHISLILPTHNDAPRIWPLLKGLQSALQGDPAQPFVHEIVVVDATSTDDSAAQAAARGVPVLRVVAVDGQPPGPAALLEAACNLATGDILVWLDPQGRELRPGDVPALVGPLLHDPHLLLVKPFWAQAADDPPDQGPAPSTLPHLLALSGDDLAAVPIWTWLRVFYPRLGAVRNPLGRVFAARRSLLHELLPTLRAAEAATTEGSLAHTGHDTAFAAGLLLETAGRYSTRALAQIELPYRARGGSAPPPAGPDPRQVADLLAYLATRPAAIPLHDTLIQLRNRILRVSA
ncbi:MAG: glycosyltransferase [Chloroflexota bacterium]|nr:glycosyltransferase [Chloroflexota bacterium]